MTSTELQQRIAAELDEADLITAKAEEQDRLPNDEEQAKIDALQANAQAMIEEKAVVDARVASRERQANLRKQFEGDGAPSPRKAVTSGVRDNILDDPKRGWASANDLYKAVHNAAKGGAFIDPKLHIGAAATGASFGDGASLGFLLPPEFSNSIWDNLNTGADSLLSMTDQHQVDGESLTFPANAETSRATGSRYGGVRGYWIAEADQITSSKPKVRQMKLEPQELAVLVYGTEKLLKNSGAAENYISDAASDEIRFMVGDAIVNGDGAGKPLGLLNSGSVVQETRGTANLFRQKDVANMWARLHARMMPTAVWLINQSVLPQLLQMFHPVENVAGSENVGGFNASLFNAQAFTLMGRPIILSEYTKALGTTGDVILANLGSYATGTRGGVDSAMSIHLRFDYAETAFRFMFAVDGESWMNSAITPFAGSTLSNIITLS